MTTDRARLAGPLHVSPGLEDAVAGGSCDGPDRVLADERSSNTRGDLDVRLVRDDGLPGDLGPAGLLAGPGGAPQGAQRGRRLHLRMFFFPLALITAYVVHDRAVPSY